MDGALASDTEGERGSETGGAPASEATSSPEDVPSPAPGPGRLWAVLYAVLAAVVLGAVVLIVAGVYRHRVPAAAPAPAASPAPDQLSNVPPPNLQANDGGSLKIVAQGFTQLNQPTELTLTPGYGPGHPEPYMPVRVGIAVENTSKDEVAYRPKVHIDYLDVAGNVLPVDDTNGQPIGVAAIYPGERADLAAYFSIDSKIVASLRVQVTGAVWLARGDAPHWVSPAKADGVTLVGTASPGVHVITFKVHSGYDGPVNALPYAIYRDASGAILGSADITRAQKVVLTPGDSVGSITVTDWLPARLDPTRIEVYLLTSTLF